MKNKEKLIDLYTSFTIASFENIEMTKLSKTLNGKISHDMFTKMLKENVNIEEELVKKGRKIINELEKVHGDGAIIIDDTLVKKPNSKENELISYHYDNSEKRTIKGIGIVNFLYTPIGSTSDMRVPISFEPIIKDIIYEDPKNDFKEKRKSSINKNEIVRNKLTFLKENNIKFKYVLGDSWFASVENIEYIDNYLNKKFIFRIKDNRLIALSEQDKINGNYIKIKDVDLSLKKDCLVYIKGSPTPFRLTKLYVKNGMNYVSTSAYLLSNIYDMEIITLSEIYQKRWRIEEFHKSLKQNLKIERSPTKISSTQLNHIFLTFLAFIKLEKLRTKFNTNHYALKEQLYLSALQEAMKKLNTLEEIKVA